MLIVTEVSGATRRQADLDLLEMIVNRYHFDFVVRIEHRLFGDRATWKLMLPENHTKRQEDELERIARDLNLL